MGRSNLARQSLPRLDDACHPGFWRRTAPNGGRQQESARPLQIFAASAMSNPPSRRVSPGLPGLGTLFFWPQDRRPCQVAQIVPALRRRSLFGVDDAPEEEFQKRGP